jgi:hypothetical protein
MAITFGLDIEDEEYDLTCAHSRRWPEPAADSYVPLYMEIMCSETTPASETDVDGACEVVSVPHHTIYSYFVEGDYKRASMDAEMYTAYVLAKKNETLEGMDNYDADVETYWYRTAARERYAFAGKVCIYWDNWDGMNPQPWKLGDCGLQALWMNDAYLGCAKDQYGYYLDEEYALTYDCSFLAQKLEDEFDFEGEWVEGCLEVNDDGSCAEYECLQGEWVEVTPTQENGYAEWDYECAWTIETQGAWSTPTEENGFFGCGLI